jgi:hypothetical protein
MFFLIKKNKEEYLYLYECLFDEKEKKDCQIYNIFDKRIILKYDNKKKIKNIDYVKNLIKIKK